MPCLLRRVYKCAAFFNYGLISGKQAKNACKKPFNSVNKNSYERITEIFK